MNKQHELPQAEDSRQHYSVPEDYFSQLEERILTQIPEEEPEAEEPKPSLWIRLRPIAYLAAVFVSLNLLSRGSQRARRSPPQSSTTRTTAATIVSTVPTPATSRLWMPCTARRPAISPSKNRTSLEA